LIGWFIYLFIYLRLSSTVFRVNLALQQAGQTGGRTTPMSVF